MGPANAALAAAVFVLAGHTAVAAPGVLISQPGGYPRAISINTPAGVQAVAVAERGNADFSHRLAFLRRTALSPEETWADTATVQGDTRTGVDLANGYLWQDASTGTLLCAYRYHTDVGTPQVVYRIAVSSSADYGATWAPLANITTGPVGVWEPALFAASWDAPGTVRVFYSAELTNGGEQDIVMQASTDLGRTWSPVLSRVHTAGSRNGMPGVVEVPPPPPLPSSSAARGTGMDSRTTTTAAGAATTTAATSTFPLPSDWSFLAPPPPPTAPTTGLVLVFEGFWTGVWGHFTVNSARSFDGGLSWVQRQVVHAPDVTATCNGPLVPCCAGSPQIGVCYEQSTSATTPAAGEESRALEGGAGAQLPAGGHGSLRSTAGSTPTSTSSAPFTAQSSPAASTPNFTLAVAFMSNEAHPGDAPGGKGVPWPDMAGVGLVTAQLDPTNASAPINWTVAQGGAVLWPELVSPSAYWPSVFTDAGTGTLRLAYQATNGSAVLSGVQPDGDADADDSSADVSGGMGTGRGSHGSTAVPQGLPVAGSTLPVCSLLARAGRR